MIEFFDTLRVVLLVVNALTGGLFLPVLALVLIVAVTCGIWALCSRSRPVEELADPAYNPVIDGAYDVFEGGDDDR